MISRIFIDLDECILHTVIGYDPGQTCFEHSFGLTKYYTIFRPSALKLIEFCRNLVGAENVYILTASIREYAHRLNVAGNFGFDEDHIFTREDIRAHCDGDSSKSGPITDENNVLIDNLPSRENETKCSFIGMKDLNRYTKVREYWGVNNFDKEFLEDVIEELNKLYEDNTPS